MKTVTGLAHSAKSPNDKAMKRFMRVARDVRHDPNNTFFVSRETGEILASSWKCDSDNLGEVPSDRYVVRIKKNAKLTWDELYKIVDEIMTRIWLEEEITAAQKLRELENESESINSSKACMSMDV